MKFVAIALLCIGAAMAQAPAEPPANNNLMLIDSLEKRASALLIRVEQVLQENRGQFNNLLYALDRQSVLIEAMALNLKVQSELASTGPIVVDGTEWNWHKIHEIHVMEEELLRLENRASEEIEIIEAARAGGGRRGETPAQLVQRGERLVKDAQDAVAKFPQAPEVKEINSEIIVVQSLIKAIQATPSPAPADLQKDEDELFRQETTLRQLIEKATQRRPTV